MTTETLPRSHADQAREALAVANGVRVTIAGIRQEIRDLTRSPYVTLLDPPDNYRSERLARLLMAVPGVGQDRIAKVTRGLVYDYNIRLGRLSPKTRLQLARRLAEVQPKRPGPADAFKAAFLLGDEDGPL